MWRLAQAIRYYPFPRLARLLQHNPQSGSLDPFGTHIIRDSLCMPGTLTSHGSLCSRDTLGINDSLCTISIRLAGSFRYSLLARLALSSRARSPNMARSFTSVLSLSPSGSLRPLGHSQARRLALASRYSPLGSARSYPTVYSQFDAARSCGAATLISFDSLDLLVRCLLTRGSLCYPGTLISLGSLPNVGTVPHCGSLMAGDPTRLAP